MSKVKTVIQENLGGNDYEGLCRELHSIPPPPSGGSYGMLGVKLWLLTSPMRSWMELAWGLYRSCRVNEHKVMKQARRKIIPHEGEGIITALKQARHEIILDEGEEIITYFFMGLFPSCLFLSQV